MLSSGHDVAAFADHKKLFPLLYSLDLNDFPKHLSGSISDSKGLEGLYLISKAVGV